MRIEKENGLAEEGCDFERIIDQLIFEEGADTPKVATEMHTLQNWFSFFLERLVSDNMLVKLQEFVPDNRLFINCLIFLKKITDTRYADRE